MNPTPSPVCLAHRLFFSIATGATLLASAHAELATADHAGESSIPLERLVVSASRTPQDIDFTPSSVSLVPLDDLQTRQVPSLSAALSEQPGVIVLNTGAFGGQSSILMRGANAEHTVFVVDGVRMNDRSAQYLNFLGAADLTGIDRVEVLRGPQSTLYGSAAMGGVILIDTTRGCNTPTGSISATAGSFSSYGAAATVSGGGHSYGYSASLGHFETDNDRPNNAARQWSYSARLEDRVAPALLLGATFRGQNAFYDEPGSLLYFAPGSLRANNSLTTVYGEVDVANNFVSRLTLASHLRQYTWTDTYGASPQQNNRSILDWQNTWEAARNAEIVAGFNWEDSKYAVGGNADTDHIAAGYISATVRPINPINLTAGLRYDDYTSVGSATTGRVGVAWLPMVGTKVHATYGTGFNAPSTSDRYGVPAWGQIANSNLAPEKSRGWDVGVEQSFFHDTATVDVTYFRNKFRGLFQWQYVDYVTYQGMTVNLDRARTQGVEIAATGKISTHLKARVSYTYLDARDSDTGARLTRRPRHTGDASIESEVLKNWILGAGIHLSAGRLDGSTVMPDYAVARIFTSYALRPDLLLKLRVENALDKSYQEVRGYPALPVGVFAGAEWKY